MHSEHRK